MSSETFRNQHERNSVAFTHLPHLSWNNRAWIKGNHTYSCTCTCLMYLVYRDRVNKTERKVRDLKSSGCHSSQTHSGREEEIRPVKGNYTEIQLRSHYSKEAQDKVKTVVWEIEILL